MPGRIKISAKLIIQRIDDCLSLEPTHLDSARCDKLKSRGESGVVLSIEALFQIILELQTVTKRN